MQKSFSFNLGLYQKRFNSTSRVSTAAINMGCTRGRGSTTRMFNYCKQHSPHPSQCINQFTTTIQPTPVPVPQIDYIYSKNNTTDDGFQVGAPVTKDMSNEDYYQAFNPNSFQSTFFPGMADFVDANIVIGDKSSSDRLKASRWNNWGDDTFDLWGYFYFYDVTSGKYYFPLINPQNQADGVISTQTFNAFGRIFTMKQGYPVQGIFKFDITVNDNLPFIFGAYGNMGSDSGTAYETYSYAISGLGLTLYYLHNFELGNPDEQFYCYFIPKLVSQNNSQTFNAYYDSDYNSVMSKQITNGLIVYFSNRYDVKEWIVNDLYISN